MIIVNYRAAEHVLEAIAALRELDWPPEDLQVVVVDNASGDGSVELLTAGAPDATIIAADTNSGFAGGCNKGVEVATGTYVAFLNPDARPDRNWIRAAVDELERDSTIGAIASKVLDWEGHEIDFGAVGMSFDGQGYKRHAGLADSAAFDEPADVLFASGAALVMPTAIYEEVGGFDERFFMFFEDVDLGWRLWLLGYRVRYLPQSLAFHKHHVTMRSIGPWYEHYLLSRNAIYMIYKNYDDENLAKVLAPTLLLTVRRGTALGNVDRHELDLGAGPLLDDVELGETSKYSMAATAALDSFIEDLPSLTETRDQLQGRRVRGDKEITRLFNLPLNPNIGNPEYLQAFTDVVEAFKVDEVFSQRRRIAINTDDILSEQMAGPAIRVWNMAKVLSREHDVKLVSKQPVTVWHPDFECIGNATADDWVDIERWADVIVFQGLLLHEKPFLRDSNKVIVVDIYDPFHLELLEQLREHSLDDRTRAIGQNVRVLNDQLQRGDFFMCASEKQRDLWIGQLSAMQRINPVNYDRDETLKDLLATVPFGVPDEPPVRTGPGIRGVTPGISDDDKVIVWGGGIYNWFDPLTLIKAIDKLRTRVPNVRLYFLGTKHPNPDVPAMRVAHEARVLSEDLGLTNTHVFFNEGWVAYDERQNYLLDADIGVTTHLDHIETRYSFRTRVLDYFWTTLPTVSTDGDTLGELIHERRLGLAVPAQDVDALEDAMYRLLTDEELAAECRTNIEAITQDFRWTSVLDPLVEFCRTAQRTPDVLLRQPVVDPPVVPGFLDLLRDAVGVKLAHVKHAYEQGGAVHLTRKSLGWARGRSRQLRG